MTNSANLHITLDRKLDYVKHIQDKMEPDDQIIVLEFLMYFNIFESTFFKDSGIKCYKKLELLSKELNQETWFDIKKFNFFANHFANRYDEKSPKGAKRYIGLHLWPGDKDYLLPALKAVIEQGEYDEKLLYYYLTIAYRFRNNLFHGEKNIEDLGNYREEFTYINQLLSWLMKDMADNNFIKKY